MIFENALDRVYTSRVRFPSGLGNRMKKRYYPKYDEAGRWHLEEEKEMDNLYLDIQSHKDSCDINVLMARYRNGEVDVLNQINGQYGDYTEIPTNFAELMNNVIAGENMFNSLPVEVRAKFNHNFVEFMQSAGTDEWFANIGATRPVAPDRAPDAEVQPVVTKESAE